MKTITRLLPDFDVAELHIASDWHIGDRFCRMDDIRREVDYVAKTENAFLVLTGDLCNNATKNSVSDCYAEDLSPMEQMNTAVSLLSPVKDKILFAVQGNHEARTYRESGVDLTAIIMSELGLRDLYCHESAVLFLRVGQQTADNHHRPVPYLIFAQHGSGGGRKEGGKINRLADMANIIDADIYIMAHTHLPATMRTSFFRSSWANKSIDKVDHLFVNTSSQLDYGGYGETGQFKPSSTRTPIIYLSGRTKQFSARL